MKILFAIQTILVIAAITYLLVATSDASSNHLWTKISTQAVGDSRIVCHWRCSGQGHGGDHYASTSGLNYCGLP